MSLTKMVWLNQVYMMLQVRKSFSNLIYMYVNHIHPYHKHPNIFSF